MKRKSIKPQLKLAALTPVIVVVTLFALFYNGKLDTRFMHIKQYQMVIVTVSIGLLGLLSAYLVFRYLYVKVYYPIARLYRSMKRILEDDFDAPITVESSGEIGTIEKACAYLQQRYLDTKKDTQRQIDEATTDIYRSLELLEEKNIALSLSKKKLSERNRHVTSFISNMTHEVRTPMNGIIGFTNVLQETSLSALQTEYVRTIEKSARDLLTIINDILDYSKLDAGKLRLDNIPVDLRACVDEVFSLVGPDAQKKSIELIPITAASVPKVLLGDPLRVKQILTNLISNAVKFTDYGHVLIRTNVISETDNEYVISLVISDTGMGIPQDDQATLFTAFHQADPSIARRFGGSGLGLAICKKLVDYMQGTIKLESTLNQGTTITVQLTLSKLAAYEVEKNRKHRFSSLTAICCDDNPLHLEALNNGLEYWGITCVSVSSVSRLPRVLEENPKHDIVFIHDSTSHVQEIQEAINICKKPLVLIGQQCQNTYQSRQPHTAIRKPLNIQKLEDTIATALNQPTRPRSQQEELESLREKLRKLKPSILIAEDNPVNLMLFKSLLSDYTSVEAVEDGEQAVFAANEKQFAIILLDLQMPKRSGLEAAKIIYQHSKLNKGTPVILISANSIDMTQDMRDNSHIISCLQKPVNETQLLQHLIEILHPQLSNAIDWSVCMEKLSGNKTLAIQYLARFIEELKKDRVELQQHMAKKQINVLQKIAHKLHGACCFCGVNTLEQSVSKFQTLAEDAKDVQTLKPAFEHLIQSIDEVLEEYQTTYTQEKQPQE